MRTMLAVVVLAPWLVGCGLRAGAHVGAATSVPRVMWAGHVAADRIWGRTAGVFTGVEVEGRGEWQAGARLTTGLQLGYGINPARRPGALGGEVHFDMGAPIEGLTFVPHGDYYVGGTAAAIVWVGRRHELSDINVTQLVVSRVPQLVPYFRFRAHVDHPRAGGVDIRPDLGAGLAIRSYIASDLF